MTAREKRPARSRRNITRDQLSSGSPPPSKIEGILRTVGLEWTTAYGLHPDRALRWILLLGTVLTPVYIFAMLRPRAASGIIQVVSADRLEGTAGDPANEEKRKKQLVHAKGWRAALPTAAYFSLISAVNIGFEDFTPGDWIRRLQPANIHSKRSAGCGSSRALRRCSVCTCSRCGC
jgi:hypothetical protein